MTTGSPIAKTALVTGATSGIGLALARQLAGKGFDLVLVARDEAMLAKVATELSALGRRVHIQALDLTRADAAKLIDKDLAAHHINVDLLVNNAGFGVHGDFASTSLTSELDLMHLQLDTLLALTKVTLPGMLSRGSGKILNVASVYSFSPVPFQAVYGACKSFMLSFALALDNEVRPRGVTITTVCPGMTRTAFRSRSCKPDKGKGMSAEAVAEQALTGTLIGRRVVVPGLANKFFVFCTRHLPIALVPPIMRIINTLRGMIKKT